MPYLRLAGVMGPERVDPADARIVAACYDVFYAADRADDSHGFCMSAGVFANFFKRGWLGDPTEAWAIREAGRIVAWYRICLPDMENTDRCQLALVTSPEHRRRGLGRELLRHATDRAVAAGRKTIEGVAWRESPGEAFAEAAGAKPGLVDSHRVLTPSALPPGHLAELRARAERAAGGYSLVSWPGPAPDELLDAVAEVYNALEDAPHTAAMERPVWDARRIRERAEALMHNTAIRRYSVAARYDATGELVALTQIDADPGLDRWAHQGMTAVTGAHRGHRLGLLVKAALTQRFIDAEPDIERIVTMNAADNAHMIAINDALGYRPVRDQITWRLCLPGG
jgi:RimJ/RimL family protein N-acetyltransferase